MSLTVATLIPGLLLILLGMLFLLNNSAVVAALKAFPRSRAAAFALFAVGAAWFLYIIWHLSAADFGDYRTILFFGFAAVAILSFFYVPDFLAVRGACVLMLLAAAPLLQSGFLVYHPAQIFLYKIAVYLGIVLAIYLGASPFRLRDFLQWLYNRPSRARWLGASLLTYGVVLSVVAFTY